MNILRRSFAALATAVLLGGVASTAITSSADQPSPSAIWCRPPHPHGADGPCNWVR